MMRAIWLIGVFLLAVQSAFAQAPDPAPSTPVETLELAAFEPTREEAVLEAYIDGVVAAHMREHRIPGVSVAVVQNGKPLFEKGYGYADVAEGEAATGETLFRIGSVSKTFIWTAVMILHDRGEIDLDADVNQYLQGMAVPEKYGAPVTMNDLMAHRAGFEDSFGVFTIDPVTDESLTGILIATMPARVFPPGARTSYSNWGSALAAKIVEDISGKSYRDFLVEEMLNPLQMDSTALYGPDKMSPKHKRLLSKGYKIEGGTFAEMDLMNIGEFAPAGAMSLSAEDMARWMQFHLNEGALGDVRLMAPETHRLMWSRHFPDRQAGADVSHGFFSRTYKGLDLYSHGGATAAFFTNMTLAPSLDIGVYVSQNATTDRSLVTGLDLLVLDHLLQRRSDTRIAANFSKEDAEGYAGAYLANRRSFTQFEKIFAAPQLLRVSAAEDGVILQGEEAVLYRPVADAADTFESDNGARIVFGRDSKGRVTHLSDGSAVHSYDKPGVLDNGNLLAASIGGVVFFSLTTIAGAWRRQGRTINQHAMGRRLGLFDFIAAVLVLVFIASLIAAVAAISAAEVTAFASYPFASIGYFRIAAYLVFGAAALGVASLAPAWVSSGWGVWRKLHHTAFALSLALLAVLLVNWRIIFSATA